jgi:hypothetical protein
MTLICPKFALKLECALAWVFAQLYHPQLRAASASDHLRFVADIAD